MAVNTQVSWLALSLLTITVGCTAKKESTTVTASGLAPNTVLQMASKPVVARSVPESSTVAPARAGTWVYGNKAGKSGTASVTAAEVLDFPAPFNGGSTVTLTLRHRDDQTIVSLSVSKGQFTSSFQGGNMRIRFDNQPAAVYAYSAAANGATDVVFFDAVQPLTAKLKMARKTTFDAGFYGHGIHKVTFNTAGVVWTY